MNGGLLLSGLWPPFAEAVRYLDNFLSSYSITFTVISGFRSNAEQANLYAMGRTPSEQLAHAKKYGTGGSVTDAPPGMSPHNYGLAVDIDGDAPNAALVMQVARAMGFGTVSWDPFHLEWPQWRQLVGV